MLDVCAVFSDSPSNRSGAVWPTFAPLTARLPTKVYAQQTSECFTCLKGHYFVGKPDVGNPQVRFDERGEETWVVVEIEAPEQD